MAPPPSINRLESLGESKTLSSLLKKLLYYSIITLLGHHVSFSFFHQMEKGKGKEEGGG